MEIKILLLLLLNFIVPATELQNLFCNGDFENNTFTYSFDYLDYHLQAGFMYSGDTCWIA